MARLICLFRMIAITCVLFGGACSGKGVLPGSGGTGGAAGRPGSDPEPLTHCPSSPLQMTEPCLGSFACQYETGCTCHGCCSAFWMCVAGTFQQTSFNDTCGQGPPCEDGGA